MTVHLVTGSSHPSSAATPEAKAPVTPERQARRIMNRALDFAQRFPKPNTKNGKDNPWDEWPNSTILSIELGTTGDGTPEKPHMETAKLSIKTSPKSLPLHIRVQARIRGMHNFPDQIIGEIQGGTFKKIGLFPKDTELQNQHSAVMILQFPDGDKQSASIRMSRVVLKALKNYYNP